MWRPRRQRDPVAGSQAHKMTCDIDLGLAAQQHDPLVLVLVVEFAVDGVAADDALDAGTGQRYELLKALAPERRVVIRKQVSAGNRHPRRVPRRSRRALGWTRPCQNGPL